MEYGKEAVLNVLNQLVELGRLDPRQRTTLMAAEFIDSPKVCVQIVPLGRPQRQQYEVMVACMLSQKVISVPVLSEKWWNGESTLTRLEPIDGVVTMMGIHFRQISLDATPIPSPKRHTLFLIEDIETGEVYITENAKFSEGLQLIRCGRIGPQFKKRFGDEFKSRVRVYACNETHRIDKYQLEIYLLALLVDRSRAAARARVMSRVYRQMHSDDRAEWHLKYPHTGHLITEVFDDMYVRRSSIQ